MKGHKGSCRRHHIILGYRKLHEKSLDDLIFSMHENYSGCESCCQCLIMVCTHWALLGYQSHTLRVNS